MMILLSSFIVKLCQLRVMEELKKILAQFIDFETGGCLTCGHVHSFHNLDEAISRRRQNNINNNQSLDKLFWEAAV
jgi:hypothetical protein